MGYLPAVKNKGYFAIVKVHGGIGARLCLLAPYCLDALLFLYFLYTLSSNYDCRMNRDQGTLSSDYDCRDQGTLSSDYDCRMNRDQGTLSSDYDCRMNRDQGILSSDYDCIMNIGTRTLCQVIMIAE